MESHILALSFPFIDMTKNLKCMNENTVEYNEGGILKCQKIFIKKELTKFRS